LKKKESPRKMFAPLLARTSWLHKVSEDPKTEDDLRRSEVIYVGLCFIKCETRTPELRSAIRSALAVGLGKTASAEIHVSSAMQLPAAVLAAAKAGAGAVIAVYPHHAGKLIPSLLATTSAGVGTPVIQVFFIAKDLNPRNLLLFTLFDCLRRHTGMMQGKHLMLEVSLSHFRLI